MIACKTTIAKGIARLEGQRGGHSGKLFPEDRADMARARGWPGEPFAIPAPALEAWRAAGVRGARERKAWERRLAALSNEARDAFENYGPAKGEGWRAALHAHKAAKAAEAKPDFLIQTSSDAASLLYHHLPQIIVGCADLEAPTNHKRQLSAFDAAHPGGRYIHCGVREHAMGSLVNGIAAHGGLIPLAVTYLPFSDYERPAIRMAALMGAPSIFVFSHDSIGIGKNGPTHQPVEILASLRAMPNLMLLRPCDAVETAEAWELALDRKDGPTALVFARQSGPTLRRDGGPENQSARGAYVLAQAEGGARRVTLLSSGTEVAVAMAARDILQAEGAPTAVVSMPSWDLFEAQPARYRDEVLGVGTVRVAVEAAVRLGWDRWIGENGRFVGMKGFGASGPADELYRHFGVTPEAAAQAAREGLAERA
jgi:transketolase